MKKLIPTLLLTLAAASAPAQIMISGNESKITLDSGEPVVISNAKPDSITLLDFSSFPPKARHLMDIPNSVIGPPSNIGITPDGTLALIANSLKIDPNDSTQTIPESFVHVLDLTVSPPKVIQKVSTELQPSGLSISPDGKLALVANRASGSVSVLKISGKRVELLERVPVCEPEQSASDVTISPDGKRALVSVQQGGFLSELKIDGERVEDSGRKISVYGKPYRVVITPDGELGLTAGQGFGNGPDLDALTVIDLKSDPIRTIDYVPIGAAPESFEVSPNGKLVAAVVMSGSNLPADDPNRTEHGSVVLLARRGGTFEHEQTLPVGRIPEGVAFTTDGKYLVVQCHPARELWIFRVRGKRLKDTGVRIPTPGFPSSLRAGAATKP